MAHRFRIGRLCVFLGPSPSLHLQWWSTDRRRARWVNWHKGYGFAHGRFTVTYD